MTYYRLTKYVRQKLEFLHLTWNPCWLQANAVLSNVWQCTSSSSEEQMSNSQLVYILLKSTVLESLQSLKGLESDNRKPQFCSDFALSLSSSGQTPGSAASAHLKSLRNNKCNFCSFSKVFKIRKTFSSQLKTIIIIFVQFHARLDRLQIENNLQILWTIIMLFIQIPSMSCFSKSLWGHVLLNYYSFHMFFTCALMCSICHTTWMYSCDLLLAVVEKNNKYDFSLVSKLMKIYFTFPKVRLHQ